VVDADGNIGKLIPYEESTVIRLADSGGPPGGVSVDKWSVDAATVPMSECKLREFGGVTDVSFCEAQTFRLSSNAALFCVTLLTFSLTSFTVLSIVKSGTGEASSRCHRWCIFQFTDSEASSTDRDALSESKLFPASTRLTAG